MKLVLGDQPVLYLQTVDCGKMITKRRCYSRRQLSDHSSIFYRIKWITYSGVTALLSQVTVSCQVHNHRKDKCDLHKPKCYIYACTNVQTWIKFAITPTLILIAYLINLWIWKARNKGLYWIANFTLIKFTLWRTVLRFLVISHLHVKNCTNTPHIPYEYLSLCEKYAQSQSSYIRVLHQVECLGVPGSQLWLWWGSHHWKWGSNLFIFISV